MYDLLLTAEPCTNTITTITWPPNTAAFCCRRRLRGWRHRRHHRLRRLVTHTRTSITAKLAWNRGPTAPITRPWTPARLTRRTPLSQVTLEPIKYLIQYKYHVDTYYDMRMMFKSTEIKGFFFFCNTQCYIFRAAAV